MAKLTLESWLKVLTLIGGVIAFSWGVVQFTVNQSIEAETRSINARKPFLDRQLKLYTEIVRATAAISTSSDSQQVRDATTQFWSLYAGELVLVENPAVETAMVHFKEALESGKPQPILRKLSVGVAQACRNSLAESWGISSWQQHHYENETKQSQ